MERASTCRQEPVLQGGQPLPAQCCFSFLQLQRKGLALGHREPALAGVGPVDRLCPLLAERDAARIPARARLLDGSRGLPSIEAEHLLGQVLEIN